MYHAFQNAVYYAPMSVKGILEFHQKGAVKNVGAFVFQVFDLLASLVLRYELKKRPSRPFTKGSGTTVKFLNDSDGSFLSVHNASPLM
jgi:hypothetical protein